MLFSALYKMLPSSKKSLIAGGATSKEAAWILIAAFLGGVFGIQIFSRVVHRFMPSRAVDCDHDHGHDEGNSIKDSDESADDSRNSATKGFEDSDTEQTPLLSRDGSSSESLEPETIKRHKTFPMRHDIRERPTLQSRMTATMASIVNKKKNCDVNGPCYGFTNRCGQDCFKKVQMRGGMGQWFSSQPKLDLRRTASTTVTELDGAGATIQNPRVHAHTNTATQNDHLLGCGGDLESQSSAISRPYADGADQTDGQPHTQVSDSQSAKQHHHHVPTNAFLSISLQTSIAIALHKLPEGFITFATNHANPTLGIAVFLAIGIHNITEGFALALPIFLASGSRLRALLLSVILGGLSQPIGAGVAAAWLKIAERQRGSEAGSAISDTAYGAMFAITAGIMASVALSLLQESYELSHNKGLCMAFTFVGMGILGVSSALTA